jgi:hypothetical protein
MASERSDRQPAQVEQTALVENVMSRVPDDILQALSEDQVARLRAAIAETRHWRKHPIDIRLSLPLFTRRLFLTLVGGIDARGADRRAKERTMHPVATRPNVIFLGIAIVVLYALAGLVALMLAAALRGG